MFKNPFNLKLRTSNLKLGEAGFTLIEMLVVMAILAILAAVALPYAEITVKRDKELELKRNLRSIRESIDQFHDDWKSGKISKLDRAASDDGYPRSLQVLVEGVEQSGPRGVRKKYLRRVPLDPFTDSGEGWGFRSYQDKPEAGQWGGQDVYDVHSTSDQTALNETHYRDW